MEGTPRCCRFKPFGFSVTDGLASKGAEANGSRRSSRIEPDFASPMDSQ